MVSASFDTFLRLEDADGKELARNDDSGGELNAQIVFTAPKSGDFRIIATSYEPAKGLFVLNVKERLRRPQVKVGPEAGKLILQKDDNLNQADPKDSVLRASPQKSYM